MLRKVLPSTLSSFTAALSLPILRRRRDSAFRWTGRSFFSDREVSSDAPPQTRVSELPRVDSIVDGCDYKHWLVVMKPPDNYPQREEIIEQYVETLAVALGSEKAARESIYSISTKYYYAFSCKVSENVIHTIKFLCFAALPGVKWVLADSYLGGEESGYGGEPYFDGKVVPYEEKYHADWLCDVCDEDDTIRTHSRKTGRRRRGSRNSRATSY